MQAAVMTIKPDLKVNTDVEFTNSNQPVINNDNKSKMTQNPLMNVNSSSDLKAPLSVNNAFKHKNNQTSTSSELGSQVDTQQWYIQLGAYSTLSNAQKALVSLTKQIKTLQLIIAKNKGYFRIVSQALTNKSTGLEQLMQIKHKVNGQGFMTQMRLTNTEFYSR